MMLDKLFGRECFLNEIIWAYDYGARAKKRSPAKHDNILVYVKDPDHYYYDSATVDREPYMAPGLVTPEKAALGKLPTDVWWHTIVSPTGKEKTGYPNQKPEGVLRRIVQASTREDDWVLDFFAGSGTTGAVAAKLGRRFIMVDNNPEAWEIMRNRLGNGTLASSVEHRDLSEAEASANRVHSVPKDQVTEVITTEDEISAANQRARASNFNASHTGSAGYAGYLAAVREELISPNDATAVLITGVHRPSSPR